MAQLSQFLQKKNNIFFLIIFLNLFLRYCLCLITLGGGDSFNAQDFYIWTINNFDYYTLINAGASPPPYLPFSKLIYLLLGNCAEYLNLSYSFLIKFSASFCDLIIGLIIFKYLNKKKNKNSKLISLIYLFNPLSIYICTQLGFQDSFVILLLVYCCYKFDQKYTNQNVIALSLALSFCIKPFTFIFFPFFFINSEKKIRFLIVLLITIVLANSFYLREINYDTLIKLLHHIFIKITIGHQISNHGLGLLSQNLDKYFLGISYLLIAKIFFILSFSSIHILFVKNIQSIKFVYLIFFSIFMFSSNVHWQYFYWILPFMFIYKFNLKTLIFNIGFFVLVFIFSIKSAIERNDSGLYILKNNKNYFDYTYLNENIFNENQIYLILIYFVCLILNFKINLKSLFRFIKKLKKVNLNSLLKGKKNNHIKFEKIYLSLFALFLVLFISNINHLFNSTKNIKTKINSNSIIENKVSLPKYFEQYLNYGNKKTVIVDLNDLFKNNDIIKVIVKTNHFYEINHNRIKEYNLGYKFKSDLGGSNNLFIQNNNEYILSKNLSDKLEITFNQFNNHKDKNYLEIYFENKTDKIELSKNNFKCIKNNIVSKCDVKFSNKNYIFLIDNNFVNRLDNRIIILIIFLIIFGFQLIFVIIKNSRLNLLKDN